MVTELTQSLLATQPGDAGPVLHLFGGPFVTHPHRQATVPQGSKRLLVFVALRGGPVDRAQAAGTLWPASDEERAAGNLRSALWRLSRVDLPLLTADKFSLALHPDVIVDAHLVGDWAARLINHQASPSDLACLPSGADAVDLLPGWYDYWALIERERLRQRMLHALEALSRQLVAAGRCAEGIEAAVAAVAADPLRESAQRALIEAHLAEGNRSEGRRQFETYRATLRRELGIEPTPTLAGLVCHPNQQPPTPAAPARRPAPPAADIPPPGKTATTRGNGRPSSGSARPAPPDPLGTGRHRTASRDPS